MEKEFGVTPYLADIKAIQALYASRNFEMVEKIQKRLPELVKNLNSMYYLKESGLTTTDILRAYVAGETENYEEQGHSYVFLTEIFCKYFGKQLPNTYWFPANFEYELYKALESFSEQPAPLQIPENDDFTFNNIFLPHTQLIDFQKNFDFSVLDLLLAQDDETFREKAAAEFRNWFFEAVSQQKDLFLFIEALTQ